MACVGDVEVNLRFRKIVERKIRRKKHGEGVISLRIIQESMILWLPSLGPHKCGLDICSDRN